MDNLRRMRKAGILYARNKLSSHRSRVSVDYEVFAKGRLEGMQHLLDLSGTPSASIHCEIDEEISKQTLQSRGSRDNNVASHPPPVHHAERDPLDPDSAAGAHLTDILTDVRDGQTIYAIGSFTKFLLNAAYHRIISSGKYEQRGLAWDCSACDLFNELRRTKGQSLIRRFSRDPSILELLIHRNGFAPMNQYLLAPDGSFIMSKEEFLEAAPLITEDYYQGQRQGYGDYSNANHIFAALLLEELIGQTFEEIMKEEILVPLQMNRTAVSADALRALQLAGHNIAVGHRVSGDKVCQPSSCPPYLRDTMEAAALGAYSCTDDLAKLIRALLSSMDHDNAIFKRDQTKFFFGAKSDQDDFKSSLAGLVFDLDSPAIGVESTNRNLSQGSTAVHYQLGRPPRSKPCTAHYKAGTITGFSCTVYIVIEYRAFVIVLANSSGPLDITEHLSHYIIQELLDLSPETDIITKVRAQQSYNFGQVQHYEAVDAEERSPADTCKDLEDTYVNKRYKQSMHVSKDGEITFGKDKVSTAMQSCRHDGRLRILPGARGFSIDRWQDWKYLEYELAVQSGTVGLLKCDSGVFWERLSVQPD